MQIKFSYSDTCLLCACVCIKAASLAFDWPFNAHALLDILVGHLREIQPVTNEMAS